MPIQSLLYYECSQFYLLPSGDLSVFGRFFFQMFPRIERGEKEAGGGGKENRFNSENF